MDFSDLLKTLRTDKMESPDYGKKT